MKVVGVIPARLNSKRFPKKILYPIRGKPIVVYVYEQAKKAKLLDDVIIAIDSEETAEALKPFKVKTIMTSIDHVSGTDRIFEAVKNTDADFVINIQGDEPTIDPTLIDELIDLFEDSAVEMATVAGKNLEAQNLADLNSVKVLIDENGYAVNFRRKPIVSEAGGYYHHMGIYAYKKATLERFTQLSPSENEINFKLEQLRALDNGIPIKVILTATKVNKGIDTMDDLKQFESQ